MHELEAFICKALKGEAIVNLLRALNNAAYESLRLALWVKIDEKKDHHPIYHSDKMNDNINFLKPSSIKQSKDFHQFSCKIRVITEVKYDRNMFA